MADKRDQSPSNRPQIVERVKNIPAVQTAIEKTDSTYQFIKGSHHLINWALTYAEAGLNYATASAAPISAPLAKKFEEQINTVDQKLCQGLDIVEQTLPIVKQPPKEICDAARNIMSASIQPTIEKLLNAKESASNKVSSIKEISITKANELLNNQYGTMAVQGVDNTSALINKLIDHYFPPIENEGSVPAPVSAEENKVLHTLQTIGQLSSKTANRIYYSVSTQLKTIKKEEVTAYISNVISILHLTKLLNSDKTQSSETTQKNE